MRIKWRRIPEPISRWVPFAGITMPWRTVYLRSDFFHDQWTRMHESIHIEQIERDGAFVFSVKYLWWWARLGYWAIPYEIEAYTRVWNAYEEMKLDA